MKATRSIVSNKTKTNHNLSILKTQHEKEESEDHWWILTRMNRQVNHLIDHHKRDPFLFKLNLFTETYLSHICHTYHLIACSSLSVLHLSLAITRSGHTHNNIIWTSWSIIQWKTYLTINAGLFFFFSSWLTHWDVYRQSKWKVCFQIVLTSMNSFESEENKKQTK